MLHHGVQTIFKLKHSWSLFNNIHIVEAIVRNTALGHKFESSIHFIFGARNRIRCVIPWKINCTSAKLIATFGTQSMPVSHSKTQVILHSFTHYHTVFVIIAECQRIYSIQSLKTNLSNTRKEFFFSFKKTHNCQY